MPRLALAALAALAVVAALAAPPASAAAPRAAELGPEAIERVERLLRQFDADQDGTLSAQEVEFIRTNLAATLGDAAVQILDAVMKFGDTNGDGALTAAEWEALKETARKTVESIKTIMLPMSDGVRLATDVLVPPGEGKFPAILMRTPYNRRQMHNAALIVQGYALVVQDMRGRFDSEGENLPFIGCGWAPHTDGLETVRWILAQPWCDGKVGTVGGSAGGITQMLLAGAGGGGVSAQYSIVAAPSMYHHAAYVGGALRKEQVENWLRSHKFAPEAVDLFRSHPTYDDFWKQFDATARWDRAGAPAVHVGGWFDTFSQGTIDAFVGMQHHGGPGARGRQKLVMGPWTHSVGMASPGEMAFPHAGMPKGADPTRWFDAILKGQANGAAAEPAVTYYVMGDTQAPGAPGNTWRTAPDWPVPSQATPMYFRADGRLTRDAPAAADKGEAKFTFDPAQPCPTVGGRNLTIPAGPKDQRSVEAREDVVVFTSAPLEEPLEVTGRVVAKVFVASGAKDTDLSVRLSDVYPDGRSMLMAEGMLRLRYRGGFEKPQPLEPGRTVEVTVDCWSTSVIFNKGHAVRVAVTSSNTPRYDVNPGTGEPWTDGCATVVQQNRILCAGAQASHVLLPVVKGQ
jgi:hypothetical protein